MATSKATAATLLSLPTPPSSSPSTTPYTRAPSEAVLPSEANLPDETALTPLDTGDVLDPPDPGLEQMLEWMQKSSIIPQCIDAIAVNQGGFGLEVEPNFPDPDAPPDEAEAQRDVLEQFLATAAGYKTLEEVRSNRDRDREAIGNGYLEWLTTVGGDLAGVSHARGHTIRLCKLSDPVLVERTWVSPRTGKEMVIPRFMRFRRFVRIVDMEQPVYFKEFGDPRYLDKVTGLFSDSPLPLHRQATALSHSLRYCPWSEYGFPVWAYQAPEVRSAREFMELCVRWFEEGCIGLWLVSASNGAVRNKDAIEKKLNELRGGGKAFGAVFLDAVAGSDDPLFKDVGGPKGKESNTISVHDLTSSLNHELVLKFQDMIRPIIRSAWRLPPTYTGEAQEHTRASVSVSEAVAEEQVFKPLRRQDDSFFNSQVLPALGVHLWRVRTRGAATTDDVEVAKAASGYLPLMTYAGVAKLLHDLTSVELQVPDEPWVNVPLEILRVRMQRGEDINASVSDGDVSSAEVIQKSVARADTFYHQFLDVLQGQELPRVVP